jgi:hypothetical protein
MIAYCMKCRTKVEMRNPGKFTTANGKSANRGTCSKCGTKVVCIGG